MLSTNVVSAKAARPSGAGFAIGAGVGPGTAPERANLSSPVMLAAMTVPPYWTTGESNVGPENESSVTLLALAAPRRGGRLRAGRLGRGLRRLAAGPGRLARRPRLGPAGLPR